jgi:transposase
MSKRLSMRKIKEVLRLKWDLGLSNREISNSIKVSPSTVGDCLRRVTRAGLSWPLPVDIGEEDLEQKLYSPARSRAPEGSHNINWSNINKELRRKGVTRELLWYEYKQEHPEGINYSRFCDLYRQWQGQVDCCMRQNYKAGQYLFIDYAGLTIPVIVNVDTGETINAQIFVATLGASNYIFAEATASQTLPDWIGSHTRAFTCFGGTTEILIPDNLKSGVHKTHRYEPDLNPTYADMADHYGVAVIPARVCKPQDKAKAEQAVQHVERQILAKLRNRKFFSLYELNEAISLLLDQVNSKPFQKLPGSRVSQFETLEKASLKALPATPYVFAEWKKARAGVDYHVVLDGHYYSVPYTLIKKELAVRFTQNTVEVFYKNKRVASHRRSYKKGASTIVAEHMPKAHQEYAKWTPRRIIDWAKKNGKFTGKLAENIIASRKHPEQGFRSCLGIIRLAKHYSNERLEKACQRALVIGAYSYKSVQSILKNNLDQEPLPSQQMQYHVTQKHHEYVRGGNYFQ